MGVVHQEAPVARAALRSDPHSRQRIALVSPLYVERATSGFSARLLQIQWALERVGGALATWDLTRGRAFRAGERVSPEFIRNPRRAAGPPTMASAVRSLGALALFAWPAFNVRTLADARHRVLAWIDRERPACVILTHPWSSGLIPEIVSREIRVVVDCQNVESDLARQLAGIARSWPARLEARVQARALARLETRFFPLTNEIWLPSLADIARQRVVCERPIQTRLVPNALNLTRYRVATFPLSNDIVLPAHFGFEPNVVGARALRDEVLPRVTRSIPGARLILLGRDPDGAAHSLTREPDILATGEVVDTFPYLRRAGVVVAPILQGGGTRYKILEALALGRPVVTTPLGCEGLEVRDGEHLLVRDIDEFPEAITRLLNDPALGVRLGLAGRRLIESRYSWETVEQQVRQALGALAVRSVTEQAVR